MTDFVQSQIEQSQGTNFACDSAEKAVISRMLAYGAEAEMHAGELTEGDFYYTAYGKMFRAIQAVVTQQMKVDYVTVDAAIRKLFPNEAQTLVNAMVDTANAIPYSGRKIGDYIRIIKELSARRQGILSVEGILTALKDPTQDVTELLSQLQAETEQIQQGKHKWQTLQDVLLATYEYLDKRQRGEIKAITTGVDNVDKLIGGFFGGELTVIGARPAVGKSAFGANIALFAARAGYKVAVVSREMTDIQYGARVITHESLVDGMALRKGEINPDDWNMIAECLQKSGDLPIEFLFTVRTVEDLCNECRRKVQAGALDMLIVDYLQLMGTQRRFREEHLRVGYISTMLKHLATECNIPVIALAQVNRDTDGSMPTLKHLKASGDIEQDADGVIFLHKPQNAQDPYVDPRDKADFETLEEKGLSYLCIYVAKQRQGITGKACVIFDPKHMRYDEILRRQ